MIKKVVALLLGVFLALVFCSCVSTKTYTTKANNESAEELITITGKGGVYFEGIDDNEDFKKTRSIRVTEGEHILKIGVEKGNAFFTSKISSNGNFLKKIYAIKGKNICIDAKIIEKGPSTTSLFGNYRETTTLMRMAFTYRLDTTERLGTSKSIFTNPEKLEIKESPKEIELLTELPTDRKYEILGNLKTEIKVTLFSYPKLKDEIVYKSFLYEAYTNGIDALVDVCPHSDFARYLKGYSGLGIRFIE